MKRDARTDALLARAADGTLSPEEATELAARCRADPQLTRELRHSVQIERLLALHGSERSEPGSFVREVMARLDSAEGQVPGFSARVLSGLPARRRTVPFPRPVRFIAIAAMLACACSVWFFRSVRSVPVAEIAAAESAQWAEPPGALTAGTRVQLVSGFAKLRFGRGAELILEGPAEIELTNDTAAVLHRGTAVVDVPPRATGFALTGPDARIVDVGTRFAMRSGGDRPTEVHVLDGLVLASTAGQPVQRELRTDQAIAVIDGAARPMPAEPARFMTALPRRRAGPIGYLHWNFDEADGPVCKNDGPGIDGRTTDAFFRAAAAGGSLPQRAPGVFGGGIFLDGQSAFLETDFAGIAGGRSRTVALWVRVPEDWTEKHGYALASWGSLREPGNAWQISINPGNFGGAVGHLRVGTHGDYAVGVTDLRDGQWHHVAAVMFDGPQPDVSTHVLLYVDGRLEPADVKSTRAINTDVSSPRAVKLQIGRNLRLTSPTDKRLFRGWIDEMFIADEALTQAQIIALMRDNRFVPEARVAHR